MMDLTCGFRPTTAFDYGNGSSYLRFTYRGQSRSVLRETKVCFKSYSLGGGVRGLGNGRVSLGSVLGRDYSEPFSFSGRWRRPFEGNFLNPRKLLKGSMLLNCQSNDSLAYVGASNQNFDATESNLVDEQMPSIEDSEVGAGSDVKLSGPEAEEKEAYQVDELRELLQKSSKELQVARLNSTMFEEKAQNISETAIALKDEAERAWEDVNSAVSSIQEIINEEDIAKEAVQKATMALSMAEARLQVAAEAIDSKKEQTTLTEPSMENDEEQALVSAREEISGCKESLESCAEGLRRIQMRKEELQKEVERLRQIAEKAQLDSLKAEEDVANIMLLAEQAVAFELEATQRVNDAELALQRAEKAVSSADAVEQQAQPSQDQVVKEEANVVEEVTRGTVSDATTERDEVLVGDKLLAGDVAVRSIEEVETFDELSDQENGKLTLDFTKEADIEFEKSKAKKQEQQKDFTRDSSSTVNAPKASLKKSSRFFSASFFSFDVEDEEFTLASVFHGLVNFAKKQAPKLVIGIMFLGMG